MERRDFTYSQYSVQFYMKVKDRIWKKKSRIPNGAHLLDEGIQNISTHGKASFTATERLICPGWETLVVQVSQPGTPGRDQRGGLFVPGLATGIKGDL